MLCDRYMDSTRVYQSVAKCVDRQWTEDIFSSVCGGYEPDLTLLLDISPEVGLQRAMMRNSGEERFESMDIDFHHQVRSGFLDLAQAQSERFMICDAAQSADRLSHEIATIIRARFLEVS